MSKPQKDGFTKMFENLIGTEKNILQVMWSYMRGLLYPTILIISFFLIPILRHVKNGYKLHGLPLPPIAPKSWIATSVPKFVFSVITVVVFTHPWAQYPYQVLVSLARRNLIFPELVFYKKVLTLNPSELTIPGMIKVIN